jgi:hypothetical protein
MPSSSLLGEWTNERVRSQGKGRDNFAVPKHTCED